MVHTPTFDVDEEALKNRKRTNGVAGDTRVADQMK